MRAPALGWMRQLARQQRAPVPWARVVRTGVAVAAPVSIGAGLGQLGIGLLCSIGALAAALADREGPYRDRVTRIGIIAASGTAGFVLGGLAFGHPLSTAGAILAAGLISAVVSVLGNVASVAGLQFLIYLIVASGADFGSVPGWVPPLCYLAGAAWSLLLSLSGGIGRVTAPERAVVADVYRSLATVMEACGSPAAEGARRELTGSMNLAYDTVISTRAAAGGRDPRMRTLAALMNAATPVVEATTAFARSGNPMPPAVTARVRGMAVRIRRGGAAADRAGRDAVPIASATWPGSSGDREVVEIERGLDVIDEVMRTGSARRRADAAAGQGADAPSPVTRALRLGDTTAAVPVQAPGLRTRMRNLADAVTSGPVTWRPTLRLVLCLAVAELVALVDPVQRPYWIALTVAVTLKPDFGSVFARAVQRGVGTVAGVLLGSGLLLVLPGTLPALIAIGVFAAALPLTQRRNYGMFATFLTPVIVLLLDLGRGGEEQIILGRVLDTSIGCAIVLLVGYLPWPDTWRSRARFGDHVADAADAVLEYVRAALGPGPGSGSRQSLRRHTYRMLSDLRTLLQQALSEPPPVSRSAAAWWPAVVALERMTDAVTALVIGVELGRVRPAPAAVRQVIEFLEEFSAAIRRRRRPGRRPLPEDAALAGVVGELRVAGAVLAGPEDDESAG